MQKTQKTQKLSANQYLSQALLADREINRKIDRLADLYAACTRSSSMLTLAPGGGHDSRSFERRMEKYILLRDEINADIDALVDLKTEIMKVIDAVPDEDCRCVLEKYYLQGRTLRTIGEEIGYDKDYVYQLKRKALSMVQIPE